LASPPQCPSELLRSEIPRIRHLVDHEYSDSFGRESLDLGHELSFEELVLSPPSESVGNTHKRRKVIRPERIENDGIEVLGIDEVRYTLVEARAVDVSHID